MREHRKPAAFGQARRDTVGGGVPGFPSSRRDDALWRVRTSLPGVAASVGDARAWLRSQLLGHGVEPPENAGLVLSELVTNAVRHTRSGLPDGRFAVRLLVHPDRVRLEVHDAGPLTDVRPLIRPAPDTADGHGRGLVLVDTFASRWGRLANGHGVYAETDR
jgi:anti-sigma regulatory factor (Ser/Thr protein kinase)